MKPKPADALWHNDPKKDPNKGATPKIQGEEEAPVQS